MTIIEGESWKGPLNEDLMTEKDILSRAGDQARAMLHGGDPFLSSPDEDFTPTGGCYNMDYPDSYHDAQNERLSNDPTYAAEIASAITEIIRS